VGPRQLRECRELVRVRLAVEPVHRGQALVLEEGRHRLVGGEHAFLDEPVAVLALALVHALGQAFLSLNNWDLAAREFGRLSEPKEHAGVAAFYEVGGSGGDVAYLSSLSPHYSAQVLYEAKFAKLGKGYIRITVIQLAADSPFEILGVYFGLPVKDPHSKQAILEITRKQLIQMGVPITPEVEQQMAASLTPVRYPAPQGSSQHVQ